MTKYIVTYGVPFNIRTRSFKTEYDAKKFISEHVFEDSRYCRLEKVEELNADFKYVPYYKVKDRELSHRLFEYGIIKKQSLEEEY